MEASYEPMALVGLDGRRPNAIGGVLRNSDSKKVVLMGRIAAGLHLDHEIPFGPAAGKAFGVLDEDLDGFAEESLAEAVL